MDKIPSRTELNKELYNSYEDQSYDRFDVNSNQEVLKDDVRRIDVNQIRDMLDKKYRDNIPKRKSIDIEMDEYEEPVREITKEYDLKAILSKTKEQSSFDYDKDKRSKSYDVSKIVEDVRNKYPVKEETEEEKELKELIHTIAQIEIKNAKKDEDAELLGLEQTREYKKEEIKEEEFYTGDLKINNKDFEDFKDIEKDINSSNKLVKVLIFIFILLVIVIAIVVVNKYFELGLF